MKTFVAGFAVMLLSTIVGAQVPAVSGKDDGTKKPVATTPAKKDDKKKKADEMGKIEGIEIPRGTGFLGIQLASGTFKLTSYDAKKKPVAATFTKVALRWNVPYQPNPERELLLPGPTVGTFVSQKIVRPPHTFYLTIILLTGEAENAPAENIAVNFHP